MSQTRNRSAADTLLQSDPSRQTIGLRGAIPPNTFNNQDRLAKCLGLDTIAALKRWMDSKAFAPIFEELYATILHRGTKQGPKLPVVQHQLAAGEKWGDMKYSNAVVDKTGWTTVDHYALCLYKLKFYNKKSRDGVFFQKNITDSDMEARLWQAMLRASLLKAPSKSTAKPTTPIHLTPPQSSTGGIFAGSRPFTQGPAPPSRGPPPHKKHRSGDYTATMSSVKASTGPTASMGSAEASTGPTASMGSAESSTGPTPNSSAESSTGPTASMSSAEASTGPTASMSSAEASAEASTGPTESSEAHHPSEEKEENEDNQDQKDQLTDLERIIEGKNPDNPHDLQTAYGQYSSLHMVTHAYNNLFVLQRMRSAYATQPGQTIEQLEQSRRAYDQEIENIINKKRLTLEPTSDEISNEQKRISAMLDNPEYQPQDYLGACRRRGIQDPERPQLEGMDLNMVLKPHQVTGIDRGVEVYRMRLVQAFIIADSTGLGKTHTLLGIWIVLTVEFHRRVNAYHARVAERDAAIAARRAQELEQDFDDTISVNSDDRINIPPLLVLPIGKPKLLIVLPALINQIYSEIRKNSPRWRPLVYYGDTRGTVSRSMEKIENKLQRNHWIFDGAPGRADIIVITTLPTLVKRHGPAALRTHRTEVLKMNLVTANSLLLVRDPNWLLDLGGLWDYIGCDECQILKNPDSRSSTLLEWWQAFLFGASASLLGNGPKDIVGLVKYAQNKAAIANAESAVAAQAAEAIANGLKAPTPVNPYTVPDDHIAAPLRLSMKAVDKYISNRDQDPGMAGLALAKLFKDFVIRRTYSSADPSDQSEPPRRIGEGLARLNSRRILCRMTKEEKAVYATTTKDSYRRLMRVLLNGDIVWNRRYARRLVMQSGWTGWYYIEEDIHADTLPKWKNMPNLLWNLIKQLIMRMEEHDVPNDEIPVLPNQDDIIGQLAIICRGSPKVRGLLTVIAELVILRMAKLCIWASLPATQILIYAILQALNIRSACYTSELSGAQRDELVEAFTTSDDCMVFIGSYYLGSVGLNLQAMCNHTLAFDLPQNIGAQEQSDGRTHRIGQKYDVEKFQLHTPSTFDSKMMHSLVRKAIPGAIAELTVGVIEEEQGMGTDNTKVTTKAAKLYMINDKVVGEDDPRVTGGLRPLSAQELVNEIIRIGQGAEVEYGEAEQWEDEALEFTTLEDEV